MPWDPDANPADERADFVEAALARSCPFARLCRDFLIAPRTGYQWLRRAAEEPGRPLADRTRRPHRCPAQTPPDLAQAILQVHDDYGWGARKVRAFLLQRGRPAPSLGAVHHVLRRAGRVRGCSACGTTGSPPDPPCPAPA